VRRAPARLRLSAGALATLWLPALACAQLPAHIQELVANGRIAGLAPGVFSSYQPSLREFYESRAYEPAWLAGATASPQALALIEGFRVAWQKGLEPQDYGAGGWQERLEAAQGSQAAAAGFDVALTLSVMRYVSDLRLGRINPQHVNFALPVQEKAYDLAQFLAQRLLPASDTAAVLALVEPPFEAYWRTEGALVRYTQLAAEDGGQPLPVPATTVEAGQPYTGLARLSELLHRLGDLPDAPASPPALYEGSLVEAVQRFQRRHGLDDDGRLGAATLQQLNVPLAQRVRQLQLALERWRWLPEEFSSPPIIVNIPDFRLRALRADNSVDLQMRVVVGKAMLTETPVFSRDMTYVVFRPYWVVPPGIMRRQILPALKRDRGYLARNRYEITTHGGNLVTDAAVSDEELAQLQAGKLAVRQRPGPNNALGLVKLMFPNEHHVYLHSTPATELFARSRRDFSSGCIRVEQPAELTAWVLRDNPGWTLERIRQTMNSGSDNVTVKLARRTPVFIVYGTAIAYADGEVHFYPDLYGHDARLAAELRKRAAAPHAP
jgi:murein L,D-transpeptidase YcbB/YkuD